jgi:predicted DNA-binding transcriptional regulator YafY
LQKVSQQLIKIARVLYAAQTPPHFMDILLKATKEKCAITFDYRSINTQKTKKYTVMPL